MTDLRVVRGADGPVAFQDRGFTAADVAEWRAQAMAAGNPVGVSDYYAAHGICFECLGAGVLMSGWSAPAGEVEAEAARMLGLENLPVCRPCPRCQGSGKVAVS